MNSLTALAIVPAFLSALAGGGSPSADSGRFQARDGATLYYEVHGSGPDTVVVPFAAALVRGLEPLASRRTVIHYDMRGRGRSAPIADSTRLGFDQDVRDLDDVRAHFGIGRISLIGFSYLAGVVATYASRWPERVDHLVLLGGIGPRAPEAPVPNVDRLDPAKLARLQAGFATADATDPVGFCREYWATYLPLFTGGGRRPTAGGLAILQDTCWLPNERPTAFLRVLGPVSREAAAQDFRAVGVAIRAPTLVVHGDSDQVAPLANARVWTEVIAGARLEIVPEAGHLLWAEAREEVLARIDRFLPGRR